MPPNGDTEDIEPAGTRGALARLALPGVKGDPGDKGDQGDAGPAGVSGYEVVQVDTSLPLNVDNGSATADCPDGKVPVSGGFYLSDLAAKNVSTREKNFIVGSSRQSTGWTVTWIHGIDNLALALSVYAVCAAAS